MAKKLLISIKDLKTDTFLDGNIDVNKILPYVSIAQDIYLQEILGTNLLERLQNDAPSFSGDYINLMTYVKPVLIHWSLTAFIPFSSIEISNKGAFKNSVENTQNLDDAEIIRLEESQKQIALYYSERLKKYLCSNSNLFPEYSTNENEDVKPDGDAYYINWVI